MNQVLLAATISDTLKKFLEVKGYEIIFEQASNSGNYSHQNIEGILTSNKLILDAQVLQKYPNLKWIARLGSGMEIIDMHYCDENNIQYFSSPAGIANSVAEHVMGMLLSLLHNIHSSQNEICEGKWIREPNRGIELESLTIGIIGYGHTGSRLAEKLSVFTKNILVYDKFLTGFSNGYVRECTLAEIKQRADILSFHVPLNQETKHYYNDEFAAQMKKKHILVNASRGAVVDTASIVRGFENGKIMGACLDVLEEEAHIMETLQKENNIVAQLLKHPVMITPHIAGYSHQAIEKMSAELMEKIRDIV